VTISISVRHLTKRFGAFTAVDDVSFDVRGGEIFGYLGANGAGKSTTIKMLCGLLAPTSGSMRLAGEDVSRNPKRIKQRIGYMSQRFSLYLDLPVRANLEFFAGAYRVASPVRRTREMVERLGLDSDLSRTTGSLPGGIRQKLALACALLHRPEIVFLDEPTAGVDPESRRSFWAIIRELADVGTTVFVTTHYLDEAEGCDRVGMMVDGRLTTLDTPRGLKQAHVPGRMFEVRGAPPKWVIERLGSAAFVADTQVFGRAVHVRCEAGTGVSAVEAALADAGSPIQVQPIDPTLEDVFLAVVHRYGREAMVT
jgi:ABC-2 type transport system ATP-binding protein